MKKRIIAMLLTTVLTSSLLAGCGKASPEAQAVMDKIKTIGTVDYDDEVLIGECEDAYAALTPEQQAEVSNTDTLAKAREEMDKLIAARPVPFTNANWESTKDDVLSIEAKSPDDEYDTDDGDHVLQYNDCQYDGYSGLVRYCFKEGTLYKVLFVMSPFDADTYKHFDDQYTAKYGEPGFQNDAGKVWYQSNANIGITGIALFGGSIIVTFAVPSEQ